MFRKGTVLLGPEEMEGEYAGEELRKEVCVSVIEDLTLYSLFFDLAARSHGGTAATSPAG